jgi:hypothetical protein
MLLLLSKYKCTSVHANHTHTCARAHTHTHTHTRSSMHTYGQQKQEILYEDEVIEARHQAFMRAEEGEEERAHGAREMRHANTSLSKVGGSWVSERGSGGVGEGHVGRKRQAPSPASFL